MKLPVRRGKSARRVLRFDHATRGTIASLSVEPLEARNLLAADVGDDAYMVTPLVDPYDPPANYYSTATGTGATLKSQLHDIIDGHTVYSYDAARSILQVTDADPDNPGHMLLVYNRASLDVSAINPGGSIPGWDSGASWNREHTWPRSRGVDTSGPDNSDLFNLRPVNPSINGARGNKNFGGEYGQSYGAVFDGGNVWYPGDADAGMIARQEMYMAVRYDGSEAGTIDLEMQSGDPSTSAGLGNLDRMMEWHYQSVPDDFERARNQIIYDNYQHNRDPFIDHPEYAWSIFKDQQNDSQLYVGAGPAADGSSATTVDLGAVIVGASVPAAKNVSLHRNGYDGTYYQVTTSGDATSSVMGRYNAFAINTTGTDSTTVAVGLGTSTATAGARSGAVTIDNLDITTQGGPGVGNNDGNDTIDVSLDVLDHANPSFAGGADQNSLVFDFGNVIVGSPPPMFSFDIYNLENMALYTAGLDFDSLLGVGDTSTFTTDLLTFSNLAAGTSSGFTATFDTGALGSYSATYTLSFSDEDLPGAALLGDLTLNFTGTVVGVPTESQIAGRHIFYNQSFFDNNNAAIQPTVGGANNDDADAIDPSKSAYLPGSGAATWANITGYDKGINGIMIDISAGPDHSGITANDFVFKVGNNNSPSGWAAAPAPTAVSVTAGAGVGGSDRVTITWATGAITKKWLEVQVKSNGNTALADNFGGGIGDVFFFGNAVGGSGDGDTAAAAPTNATDEGGARNNPRNFLNPALVGNVYDYNKDHFVNATDEGISRNNPTNFISQLVKINIGSAGPFAPEGDAGIASALASSSVASEEDSSSLPKGIAHRLSSLDLNSGRIASFFQHLAEVNTPGSRKILTKIDAVADDLGLDHELLEELVADIA